ncbi:glucose-1-phosphate thymidylyltransferase [Nitrosopumilus sp.]
MKGIILHGGHGTRLRPLTHTGPKQLLPIANKPMSQYCIESMKEAGVTDIAIIIGGVGSNKVSEFYGNGEKFGVKITYVKQDNPKGIAHAIGLCKDFIENEKFLVFLGDNIIQKNISNFSDEFLKSDYDAMILLCEVDNPSRFGIADIKNDKIIRIIEKPKDPPTNFAVTGIYFLTPKIFEIIENLKPSWRDELEITDALQILLSKNNNISYHLITEYWKDTGTPEDIIHANKSILENYVPVFNAKKESGVVITGDVSAGEGTIFKTGSKVNGPVIIGKDCIIEKNTVINPNTSIGNNCILSECDIRNSIIMSNCEIQKDVKIRNSIISSNSSIKQNETIKEQVFLLGEGTKIFL